MVEEDPLVQEHEVQELSISPWGCFPSPTQLLPHFWVRLCPARGHQETCSW